MKVFVVLLSVIGSILAARKEIGYNELPGVLAKQNALRPFGSRIVGGQDAAIEDFPFIVSLQYYGSHVCGGSIIGTNKIVTAAHCTDGASVQSLSIVAGIAYLNDEGQRISVSRIHQHRDFSLSNLEHDISTLYLQEPLTLSDTVAVIALPYQDLTEAPGSHVTVSGWGATYEGGWGSDVLQYVIIEVISNQVCNDAYGEGAIRDSMLCAGILQGGKGPCQGDSGSPLVSSSSSELVGIMSWGYGCARPEYPGVYTSVSSYRTWIDDH